MLILLRFLHRGCNNFLDWQTKKKNSSSSDPALCRRVPGHDNTTVSHTRAHMKREGRNGSPASLTRARWPLVDTEMQTHPPRWPIKRPSFQLVKKKTFLLLVLSRGRGKVINRLQGTLPWPAGTLQSSSRHLAWERPPLRSRRDDKTPWMNPAAVLLIHPTQPLFKRQKNSSAAMLWLYSG